MGATTDSSTCCEPDTAKCGGIGSVACTYGTSYYWDTAKAGTAATSSNKATVCCTEKAACSGYTCPTGKRLQNQPCTNTVASCTEATCCEWIPTRTCSDHTCSAGKKAKSNANTLYCASTTGGCTDNTCCDPDTTKCGGNTVTCNANHYQDPTKNSVTGTTATECCTAQAACSTLTCPAGKKQRTGTHYCATSACSATTDSSTCCEADTTKCGGNTVTCNANQYQDPTKNSVTGTTATECCTAQAACS